MTFRKLVGFAALGGLLYAHRKHGGQMTIESFKQSGRDLMEGLRARSDELRSRAESRLHETASRVADQTSVEAGRRPDSMKAGAQSADIGGDITGYGLGGVGGDGDANRR